MANKKKYLTPNEVLGKIKERTLEELKNEHVPQTPTDLRVRFSSMNLLDGKIGLPVRITYTHVAKTDFSKFKNPLDELYNDSN